MNSNHVVAALVEVMNSSTRPPALYPIARLKYPPRGVYLETNSDGTIAATLSKWGWEYKHRGPKPKSPPPANVTAIRDIFNAALPDGITVAAVEDSGTSITLILTGG